MNNNIIKTYDALNTLSLPISISELNSVLELKEWVESLQLPDAVNTIRFTSSYMINKLYEFDFSEFIPKEEKEYSDEEQINHLMNHIGYTSIFDMMKKNHPSLSDELNGIPCVWYDNSSIIYLIINDMVYKYVPSTKKITDKISNFFSN